MDPVDAHKTAFAGPYRHYEYTRIGMGLRNAPATFQSLMDLVLSGLQGVELYVYLDDNIVFASDIEEHGKKFRRLMKRLHEANLTIEPSKSQFLQREASFLGNIAGNGQIRPDPEKIEAVRDFPTSINKRKVKQFYGLASYYRRFVKNFAEIAYPLSQLTGIKDGKNPRPFVWGEAEQKAFEQLKECLCSKPVLAAPDLSKEFIVTTDASDFALGAIFSQMDEKIKVDHACIYASRCLKGRELRYSTYDRELLAIVFAKDQFRPFLSGRKFKVITDHEPLKHFHNTKKPDVRFNRLNADLCGYEFEIEYRPGPCKGNADALS